MSFIKQGELTEINQIENADSCIPAVNPEILENFRKTALQLKQIAPKADDFLYFSAVMLHAAEASAFHDDGTPKLNGRGEQIVVGWDKSNNTWRWTSNDPSIRPYKNSNGDIFPEEELVKAYKKWIGKPLCIDHKSSSVDHVRGFIVDTYYDRKLKRVIGLCALDKHNYPDLARKVSTGYSNCVSMGTAVGKAICADCATVARTEQDFCNHMRTKSGYGEINIDLNPIELSIVVNGADPQAKIKHIIAAANNLNNYVDSKQEELKKIADSFKANIEFVIADPTRIFPDQSNKTNIEVISKDLNSFKADVEKAIDDFKKLKETGNDLASNQAVSEADTPSADLGLAPPHARFASADIGDNAVKQLHDLTKSIEVKLSQMKEQLNTLVNISINKEENMSEKTDLSKQGYYQGAGGVNEPTPGQAKYPKDPLNDQLRLKEDKQMVGQSPFPEVGPVDGMHPSPDSADPSNELERKKMLARAEANERALRRQAIVNAAKQGLEQKKAYFQGGGGVNEPTPGKVKYPADKLNEQDRDKEDKQMVGQKPFPGVGSVDGLHPSPGSADVPDEKKRKELLQRASLRARFVKAANEDGTQNLGKSTWEVFRDDRLLLSASVDELSGGRSEMLFDSIATKEFGAKLIERVKKEGADKVRSLIKSAQEAPAPASAAEVAPPASAAEAPANDNVADLSGTGEDAGKEGDTKETALDLVEKLRDLSSDAVESVRALTGEQSEMGVMDAAPEMAAAASFSTSALNSVRKELNKSLISVLKETISKLAEHQEELEMITKMNDAQIETAQPLIQDAIKDAQVSLASGFQLMTAFVKYARGTQALIKKADFDAEFALDGDKMTTETDSQSDDDLMGLIQENNADLDAVKDLMGDEGDAEAALDAELAADDNDMQLEVKPGEVVPKDLPQGTEVKVHASYDTFEGRAALRAKIAADALGKQDDGEVQDMSKAKFSDMLDEADSLADGQTQLDVKPSDNLGKVETLPEANKEMMDVAKAPPKVRKEAESIHKFVVEGKLDPRDIDELVSQGLDKDAVAYYKKYFAQTDGGNEFASELVKEHVKAQLEEQLSTYRVKLARSYELAYDMVDRGLCANDRSAVSTQVDQIMKFNDDAFDSLKEVVARHAPLLRKEAGRIPQVGMLGTSETTVAPEGDEWSELSAAFSQTSKRLF